MTDAWSEAAELAERVRNGTAEASAVIAAALDRIEAEAPGLNCFTDILADSARAAAEDIDRKVAAGRDPGPLAGVPFAVKNLFDVQGVVTLAGSRIDRESPPAVRDAAAVAALRRAGGVLVGTLNMDEYAYGFTTENSHYGPARNPYDRTRSAGGSSGGSSAAVAGGMVPVALGSDTNGSIRVPAALCGLFGLKPTFGRISRAGTKLFAPSFDHVGILGRSVRDVALVYDLLHGPDPSDPVCSARPREPAAPAPNAGIDGIRIAVAEGYFAEEALPEALAALRQVADALEIRRAIVIDDTAAARAAAMIITAAEGSALHLDNLRSRPMDFDPMTRDRFLAGALLPAAIQLRAQSFRRLYRERLHKLFEEVDVFLTPTTPVPAPKIGDAQIVVGGQSFARAHLGRYTQPLSFIGLPAISVPAKGSGLLPLGVQLVAAPYQEATLLRVARHLEAVGAVGFSRPK